jgi:hypothetical protein
MENVISSTPIYERIIFNRSDRSVEGYTFEKEQQPIYIEHYSYKQDGEGKTAYNMFLYKKPGFQKFLRYKLHNWGVQTMTGLVKADLELKQKLKEKKEQLLETKEKLIEKKDKIKEKVQGLT